jgi:hypothetical protein
MNEVIKTISKQRISILCWFALNALDLITTFEGLRHGLRERNLIMQWFAESPSYLTAYKAGVTLALFLIAIVAECNLKTLNGWLLRLANIVLLGVVLWNLCNMIWVW